jgi:Putative zinc-binding metallo-peptidase
MKAITVGVFTVFLHAIANIAPPVFAQALATEIFYDQASSDIFPESWLTAKINAKADLLSESERSRCEEIVTRALTKYPTDFLSANLKKLYLLGGLEYRGSRTGGTNSRSVVYLVCKTHYKSSDVEKNLHAEFSSILFRNFSQHFDEVAWRQMNPLDFQYGTGGVRAVLDGKASSKLDIAKHEQGFLTQYSQASVQEDFNSFAARLLMGEAELWNAIETYPKIKAKANYVMDFYRKIESRLDKGFFQSLKSSP